MEVTPELINRFFQNECSPTEANAVVNYLMENKEALEFYMSKEEWDAISMEGNFDKTVSQKVLLNLRQRLFKKQPAKITRIKNSYITRMVAAASILVVAIGAAWYVQKINNTNNTVAAVSKQNQKPIDRTKPSNNWLVKINTGNSSMKIKLQDGSVVTLFKGAIIKYPQPFIGDTREILLQGDAFFEVAKNKLKPFIVNAGKFSTTALGTSFRITTFKEGKVNIIVKLFTGKVVVKSTEHLASWIGDVYLLPGEQLTCNAQNSTGYVSRFNTAIKTITANTADSKDRGLNNELRFNNDSLNDVMKELMALHNVKISYISTEIEKMNFTGVINRSDDIQVILKAIAQMNDLELTQTPGGFSVSRRKK